MIVFVGVGAAAGQSSNNKDEERGRTQESLMDQEKLHSLKLLLLDELLLHLPQLKDVGGVQAIPFMQVQFSSFLQPYMSMEVLGLSAVEKLHFGTLKQWSRGCIQIGKVCFGVLM